MKNHTYDVYENYKLIKTSISFSEVKEIVGNVNLSRYIKKGYQIKGKYTVKINTEKVAVGYDKFPQSLMDEWDRVRLKLLGVMGKEKRYG